MTTQRVIRFRTFNPKYNEFHYWGFIDGHFKGPPTGSGLTIEECSQSDRFTGLQDSKGVDIYEVDVIEFDRKEWGGDDNIFVVTWDSEEGCWSLGGGAGKSDMQWRKVIGHIYDPKFSHLL